MVTPSGGTAAERETLEDWQARAERSCGWGTTSSTEVPLPGGEQRRLLFPFCFGFNGGRRAAPREPEKKKKHTELEAGCGGSWACLAWQPVAGADKGGPSRLQRPIRERHPTYLT